MSGNKNESSKTGTGQGRQDSTGQQSTWEAHITFLRSRAAVARAEVSAIEAMHRDPDNLEDLLANASPEEVAMVEAVEHRISERVIAARQVADAAESDYERAVLDGPEADGTAPRPDEDTV
ncbi:hypothetical protein E3T61_15530 [Cryobacterium lactosi]|uniref:Uncharacterized protein n=1 Tax=Cryobacterium lactosi TaxID=1259202 RepID=A0A4R9BMN9_9MICO|nr:hypothetical protein [Cryobacterium lactosi]TFD87236.1 hypothetical protein E3T61_15530 [Cryobacterium lactosi]